jgi:hypothetical protein
MLLTAVTAAIFLKMVLQDFIIGVGWGLWTAAGASFCQPNTIRFSISGTILPKFV